MLQPRRAISTSALTEFGLNYLAMIVRDGYDPIVRGKAGEVNDPLRVVMLQNSVNGEPRQESDFTPTKWPGHLKLLKERGVHARLAPGGGWLAEIPGTEISAVASEPHVAALTAWVKLHLGPTAYVPAQLAQFMVTEKAGERERLAYVVVQEGGSSRERYVHGFDSDKEAQEYRESASQGAYRTSAPVALPVDLVDKPGVMDALEAIAKASAEVQYPGEEESDTPTLRFRG